MEKLVQLLKEYLDLRLAAAQLSAQRDIARLISHLIRALLLAVCMVSVLFWLSFGLAWWLAERMHWGFGGYATVAALYGLLALLVYFRRMALHRRVEDAIRKVVSSSLPTPPSPPLAPEPHATQPGRTIGADPQPTGR